RDDRHGAGLLDRPRHTIESAPARRGARVLQYLELPGPARFRDQAPAIELNRRVQSSRTGRVYQLAEVPVGRPADERSGRRARYVERRLAEGPRQSVTGAVTLEPLHGVEERLTLAHVAIGASPDVDQLLHRRQ